MVTEAALDVELQLAGGHPQPLSQRFSITVNVEAAVVIDAFQSSEMVAQQQMRKDLLDASKFDGQPLRAWLRRAVLPPGDRHHCAFV